MNLMINVSPDSDSATLMSISSGEINSLLPVVLEKEEYKKYNETFFPPRKAKSSGVVELRHFPMLIDYIMEVSSFLQAVKALIRLLVLTGLSGESTEQDLKETLPKSFARFMDSIRSREKEKASILRGFYESCPGNQVIQRTVDGFRVRFSGIPGFGIRYPFFDGLHEIYTVNYTYKKSLDTSNEFYVLGAKLGEEFNKLLISRSLDAQSSYKRIVADIPIYYDFNKLLQALNKIAGFDLFGNIQAPTPDQGMIRALSKNFNILVISEADARVMSKLSIPSTNSDPNSTEPASDKAPNVDFVIDQTVNLQPTLSLSFSFTISNEIAQFITQTPRGKRVPLVPLNTWVQIWARSVIKQPKTKSREKDRYSARTAPRYILSPSASKELMDRRKALGMYVEEGKSNEDGIFVSNNGRFHWCPSSDHLVIDNARQYEELLEKSLELSFEAGTPLLMGRMAATDKVFAISHPNYAKNIKTLKESLHKYKGSLQSYNWDYNVIIANSVADPDKLVSYNLAGTSAPSNLGIAEYLRKPFFESMRILFDNATGPNNELVRHNPNLFGKTGTLSSLVLTSPFIKVAQLYQYMLANGKGATFQELTTLAAKDLGLAKKSDSPYEDGLYRREIDDNLKVAPNFNEKENDAERALMVSAIMRVLTEALIDSRGNTGSNLFKVSSKNGIEVNEDHHYFNPEFFTLAEFSNIYNYLGGRIFYHMCRQILSVEKKFFLTQNVDSNSTAPSFLDLVQEVMPLVTILGKYVPSKKEIFEKAEIEENSIKADNSILPDNIKLPGSKEGFQIFPHQLKVQQYLRNSIPPKFAVLDNDPGGGKTISVLIDAACLIRSGHIKTPPLIIAPNNLVRNWAEDLHKITNGRWNVIPITTSSYRTWGDERLTTLIKSAPPNTIVVIGNTVLNLEKYPIVIGNHVEQVSSALEFARKFGFEYIALDESHRAKRAATKLHKAVKQLTTASSVKFVRLATGTLIKDRLTDIVGQAALLSSIIFRTAAEYEEENSELIGDQRVSVWKKDTPKKAREQLSKFASVITVKKREWAFMLPSPIETFIPVRLEQEDLGNAHQLMYDAILKETLEEIRQDSAIMKLLSGVSEEDEEDDDSEDDEKASIGSDGDLDESVLIELESKLEPYLARLEQLLTDPVNDEFGEIYFKDQPNYVSSKVRKVIERIKKNFEEYPWVKGNQYKLKDIVDYDGNRYVLMGAKGNTYTQDDYYTTYTSNTPPDNDKRWKIEPRGKVIVFCRYTRSVDAIFRALPPELAKIAVKFHGEVKNKYDNLQAFKSTPISENSGVQIIIANEQAISEGHNLQMASRFIRVEEPWSPGELDQSAARIFRPDPSGKYKRENIYLDWVLANGTLEVAKLGRLISKILIKTQFDESDNPRYDSLNDIQLPLIRMSLDTIASTPLLSDIADYIDAYQQFVRIQSSEFEEMRQTMPSKMLDVPPTPELKEARILEQVPYIPDLEIPDRHNLGLIRLNEYLQGTEDPDVKAIHKNKKELIGSYVHTEFGNGVIKNVGMSRTGNTETNDLHRRLTRVDVQLVSGDTYSAPASMIYLATEVTKENVKQFSPKTKQATKRDTKLTEKINERLIEREQRERKNSDRKENRVSKDKRLKNYILEPEESPEDNNNMELFPVVYNGFLALEASPEDTQIDLAPYGFKEFGEYAWVLIKDYYSFEGVLDYFDRHFILSSLTQKRLDTLFDSFKSGKGRQFSVELAPVSEFKNFYLLRHKISTIDRSSRKPELKVYPVIVNDMLILVTDIKTNPGIKRHIGKVIPNTKNVKFQAADSLWIKFYQRKTDISKDAKMLEKEGVVITNKDEFNEELRTLSLVQRRK